ncbi:fumarylacetoacetate (FAA) hydrolase [Cytobacillus eiseniae]|uniref:Fumarylacetoacetate (FAA) hydrolase n=1 Tax=Cytobacillus eiseniae TaxID=762947 RepID=A0ABS4RHT4_9BACI|nr:fumarylacetoacetate (FAA) hydrolase [Cytobacillus eiseniae]
MRAGWMKNKDEVIDMYEASNGILPKDMLSFLENHLFFMNYIATEQKFLINNHGVYPLQAVELKAPLPQPKSLRDFYAFEEHVKVARGNRGLEMVPEWYEMPVFYFSNHLAIRGPNEKIARPKKCQWLDYELEIACVIGKEGSDIKAENADEYIFGYCILNDWSARDLQRKEMKVGLGPAKGKDFATSIGPYIVTKDELDPYLIENRYDLRMTASVNGIQLSEGNMREIYYSFGEMIERASEGVTLYPGEIIGSGTVGSGCILELGTDVHRWLEPGDEVELEIAALGVLKNVII